MSFFSLFMKAVLTMSISTVAEAKASAVEMKQILQRPLIVGASVSGDYLTSSPGKRLALRYTSSEHIKVMARNGKPAREVLKSVNESMMKDRTAIIGIDLFFWDSFGGNINESLSALEKLQKLSSKNKLPLVLGEVPELSPQFQPHAKTLNKKIHELCKLESLCRVLPLNSLLRKVLIEGHIEQNGTKYPLQSLLPDGLHIAEPASDYLADRILELF
jgi:hypothetical protein